MAEGYNRRHDDSPEVSGKQNVPIPDPSIMTTRQLLREVFGLRELLETRLNALGKEGTLVRGIIETRLDGMDKAIRVLQDIADKFPGRIDEKINSLAAVHDEKFVSIQKQFDERDVRTEQAAGAVKIAVDAALQAQKEAASENSKANQAATAKSEASTTKLIDAQASQISNLQKAFDDKIDDLKDRQNREAASSAQTIAALTQQIASMTGAKSGLKDGWGYLVAAIGVALSLYAFARQEPVPVVPPPPQVIYVPAPPNTLLPSTPPGVVPR